MEHTAEQIRRVLLEAGHPQDEAGKIIVTMPIPFSDADERSEKGYDWWWRIVERPRPEDPTGRSFLYPMHALELTIREDVERYTAELAEDVFLTLHPDERLWENAPALDEIAALIRAVAEIRFPREEFLNLEVDVDIGVDTGDSGRDFTANTVPPACGADHLLPEAADIASIVWLTRQQGHKKTELYHALRDIKVDKYRCPRCGREFYAEYLRNHCPRCGHPEPDELEPLVPNPFLHSVANEVWHALSIFTQLYFFVRLPMSEVLRLNTLMRWSAQTGNWGGYLVIDRNAAVGFYDAYNGTASLLGIRPEREVRLPLKYIYDVTPDRLKYQYGLFRFSDDRSWWSRGGILKTTVPRRFLKSAEDLGLPPAALPRRRSRAKRPD